MPRSIFSKIIISFAIILCTLFSLYHAPASVSAADSGSLAGIVSVSSGSLNVRSSASTSSSVLKKLAKGSYVTLISKSGSWWKVEYANGKYGYCSASYIKQATSEAAYVNTTSSSLNVRTGAGTSYSVKATLPKGRNIVIIGTSGNFSRILYNGTQTGYVSSAYLKKYSPSSTYSSVALNVVDYKQTDSRWANVTLGSSGKTIRNIGCTTTALAMTESYRTGTTITPKTMASRLSYSSSGSLYWPSNYSASTDSSTYLSKIYSLLKSGKPVIIGAKTASGGQHWVVVTGFKGGSSLSTSLFTINDPGTSSRTTLAQFLSAYPKFHKIVWYN